MTTPRIIKGLDELAAWIGKEVAVSDWLLIDQARIRAFAEVTEDHQWIHLDVERCRLESPYKAPIAHGYLILSMLPSMFESCMQIHGLVMSINYGLDRVRLPSPVIAGQRIRGRLALEALDAVAGGMQAHWAATIEIENGTKPACVAQMLARYYPSPTPN
ncbi:MaoC family dehydratase [Dokdonella sp.]|uniref:MaoC family dehydratase n=1 Tax=Dokdonella sp. TaxID=2291710 RepID=UPI003C3CCB59